MFVWPQRRRAAIPGQLLPAAAAGAACRGSDAGVGSGQRGRGQRGLLQESRGGFRRLESRSDRGFIVLTRSIATTSWSRMEGTVTLKYWPERSTRGVLSAARSWTFFGLASLGQTHADFLFADGNQLAHRPLHHHRIGEVDEMDGQRILLPPDGDVEHAGAGDGDRRVFVRRPRRPRCAAV